MKKAKRNKPDLNRRRAGTGKFVKGCSGNPAGRPRGIKDKRDQLRSLLEPRKEALISKAVSLALRGDVSALKLCLERLVPALKSVSEPVSLDLPSGTLSVKAKGIFDAAISGRLSGDDAGKLIELLMGQAKIREMTELEKRLEALEQALNDGKEV